MCQPNSDRSEQVFIAMGSTYSIEQTSGLAIKKGSADFIRAWPSATQPFSRAAGTAQQELWELTSVLLHKSSRHSGWVYALQMSTSRCTEILTNTSPAISQSGLLTCLQAGCYCR